MTVTPASVASVAARCLRSPGAIDPDMPLALLGLDSLSTIEMAAELEEAFGCELPADVLIDCADARALAALITSLRVPGKLTAREDALDAMLADAALPADVRLGGAAVVSPDLRGAGRILLTGATGFLGGALLDELLEHTAADILCLVRNPDRGSRLRRDPARVQLVAGDLSHARLGLGEVRFRELAEAADAVVHCGAAVNWVYTYAGLRGANVAGTLELLRLACHRGVPFHFISSLSVCYPADGPSSADESFDAIDHLPGVHLGYAQSKIVGEALVREAARRGLPVRIYRPALISGHSRTGEFNGSDLITALVRGCVQMGTAPDLDWKLDCQPVDSVARAVLELSGQPGPVFHLGHRRPRHWRECVLWMRLYGYGIRLVPYHAWLRQLDRETAPLTEGSQSHPLRPLRTFFLNRHADAHGLTLPELYEESRRTVASSVTTQATLATAGLTAPPLDADLLDLYFERFRAEGVLPPPDAARSSDNFSRPGPRSHTEPSHEGASSLDLLKSLLGEEVKSATMTDDGSAHSIVSELTAWRSGRQTGLFRASVTLRDGVARYVRVKAKAVDTDVIAAGEALASLVDPDVGRAYVRWSARLGFKASHLRELEIYRQTDPRFLRHAPALLGSVADRSRSAWVLALEELTEATLLDSVNSPGAWERQHVEAAIDGLASLQSIWYGRETELRQLPWIGYIQSATGMAEMSDLWTALADHAAPAFSSWSGPDIAPLHRRLIETAGDWWQDFESAPRTLIHHDFNPRNICLRGGVLCAYDWELATLGAPQRDLAELLCFVLPADCRESAVVAWVERHRDTLEREAGVAIERAAWHRGFSAALYDVLVNRLSIYAMVHRVRRQSFLPRVVRTWRTLYDHFPLEVRA